MKEITDSVAVGLGVKAEYTVLSDVPSCCNDPDLLKNLVGYLEAMGGGKVYQAQPFTASDDVAFLSEQVPLVYFQLGARVEGNPHGHHNPKVLFGFAVVIQLVVMLAAAAFASMSAVPDGASFLCLWCISTTSTS